MNFKEMFRYIVKLPLHDFCIIQIQIKSNVIYKYKTNIWWL